MKFSLEGLLEALKKIPTIWVGAIAAAFWVLLEPSQIMTQDPEGSVRLTGYLIVVCFWLALAIFIANVVAMGWDKAMVCLANKKESAEFNHQRAIVRSLSSIEKDLLIEVLNRQPKNLGSQPFQVGKEAFEEAEKLVSKRILRHWGGGRYTDRWFEIEREYWDLLHDEGEKLFFHGNHQPEKITKFKYTRRFED